MHLSQNYECVFTNLFKNEAEQQQQNKTTFHRSIYSGTKARPSIGLWMSNWPFIK